jgi:hypothetical protein
MSGVIEGVLFGGPHDGESVFVPAAASEVERDGVIYSRDRDPMAVAPLRFLAEGMHESVSGEVAQRLDAARAVAEGELRELLAVVPLLASAYAAGYRLVRLADGSVSAIVAQPGRVDATEYSGLARRVAEIMTSLDDRRRAAGEALVCESPAIGRAVEAGLIDIDSLQHGVVDAARGHVWPLVPSLWSTTCAVCAWPVSDLYEAISPSAHDSVCGSTMRGTYGDL